MKFRDFLAFLIVAFLFFGIFFSLHGNDKLFNTPLSEYSEVQDTPDPLLPIPNIGKTITEYEIAQQTGKNVDCQYAGGECGVNAANVVTSIVFGYRGYDTLGEATILFVAITGLVYMVTALKGGEGK
ncbi:MAG TPA: membrane bound hydrogenase subunit MbxF [Coprothermobacter proteolyticus]|nr:membrane bound hydrogenase subunit MbxF [Coprothermobacter proteolyticus]